MAAPHTASSDTSPGLSGDTPRGGDDDDGDAA
eukprot:CAMPEP_0198350772 /NCGR_PEP_ID=MMETSP1450-20131203/100224_1 /TAXON_ID=753684 ORGANISM="Madagascaria erythrocladiodes, Strain CCMP3234" /NCGR_SAMPLE_ID=MMETSP1450 /ASSEMBLY_ACC=CAM_ASM_001115 /LENGTH=31 /DNA_ID= /DNA_START= /DNA_END= /DNA_ORIENTATION=